MIAFLCHAKNVQKFKSESLIACRNLISIKFRAKLLLVGPFCVDQWDCSPECDVLCGPMMVLPEIWFWIEKRRYSRNILLSSRKVTRMQRKYIQKLIDICGRANLSRNRLFNHIFIDLEPFENSAAALRGLWQRSHYSWIMRPQCCLT